MRAHPRRGQLKQWVLPGGKALTCCEMGIATAARLVSEFADALTQTNQGDIAFVPAPLRGPTVLPNEPTIIRVPRVVPPAVLLVGGVLIDSLLQALQTQTLVAALLAVSDNILNQTQDCEKCVRDHLLSQSS